MRKILFGFLFFLFSMNLMAVTMGAYAVDDYQSVCECDDESMLPDTSYSEAIRNEYNYYFNYYCSMVHDRIYYGTNNTAQFDKLVDDQKYLNNACTLPLYCPIYGIDDSYSDHADIMYIASDADLYQTGTDNYDVKFFMCSSARMPNNRCHVNPENDLWLGEQSGDTNSTNPGEAKYLVLRATKSVPGSTYAPNIWASVLTRSKELSIVMGLANSMYDVYEAVPEGETFATNVYYREQPWFRTESLDRVTLKQAWFLAVDAGPSSEQGCAMSKGTTLYDAWYALNGLVVYSNGLSNNGPYTSISYQN